VYNKNQPLLEIISINGPNIGAAKKLIRKYNPKNVPTNIKRPVTNLITN
jgi:hypothetical protein